MHHFEYKNGVMHAEGVPIPDICKEVGTPFYCYSTATLKRHYQVFRAPLPKKTLVCYSVKANSNLSVIATLAQEGAGADVVSAGELKRALMAGVSPSKIVFSGVGKTADELRAALEVGIHQFNVESEDELRVLSSVAKELGVTSEGAREAADDQWRGKDEEAERQLPVANFVWLKPTAKEHVANESDQLLDNGQAD